jgi:Cu2+-exporting ATPase
MLFYIATAAALITFVVWWALGDLDQSVVRTVTVLVIACPHALGLAIPLVIALSTAVSAKAGILVKDRLALERMRTVDAVLFDKTGTLTKGAHTVAGIAATSGTSDDEVLRIAGAVEADSEHPLARALVGVAHERGLRATARDFHSLTGRGVQAVVDGVTTPRPWPAPTSAWPSAPAPTWRSNPPGWCSPPPTHAASRASSGSPGPRTAR